MPFGFMFFVAAAASVIGYMTVSAVSTQNEYMLACARAGGTTVRAEPDFEKNRCARVEYLDLAHSGKEQPK